VSEEQLSTDKLLWRGKLPRMGQIIAIDGPSGAGKSTIARQLAEKIGFTFIDSGAMYRAIALAAVRAHISLDDERQLESLARGSVIEFAPVRRVLLNTEDVSEAIRTPEIASAASKVAAIGRVRSALVTKQKRIGETSNVVMEGRDIGTVVFPHAQVKIFLDAQLSERVRRRSEEQPEVPIEELANQMHERDERDRRRVDSPLLQALDAVYLDSTGLAPERVMDAILELVRARIPLERAHGES
jgi:cytidylate kinase